MGSRAGETCRRAVYELTRLTLRAGVARGGRLDDILYAYDSSIVSIFHGADIDHVVSYGASTLTISGGLTNSNSAYDTSTWSISSGRIINGLTVNNASTVDVSGGSMNYLTARGSSTVAVCGGLVSTLYAYDSSAITLLARDFQLGEGLSLDGDAGRLSVDGHWVRGMGILTVEWFDGTHRTVDIVQNDFAATILAMAIPEPATLSLLALGGLLALRRRR